MKFASSLVNSAFSKAICFSHISMKQNCHSHKGLHTLHVCLFFSHMWIQISTVTAFDTISDWWGGMQMSYQTRVHVAASLLEAWHFQSCSLIYLWSTLFWSNATCCAVISMSILRCDEIGFLWETKSTIVRQLQSGLNFCVRSNQAQCDWYSLFAYIKPYVLFYNGHCISMIYSPLAVFCKICRFKLLVCGGPNHHNIPGYTTDPAHFPIAPICSALVRWQRLGSDTEKWVCLTQYLRMRRDELEGAHSRFGPLSWPHQQNPTCYDATGAPPSKAAGKI